MAHLQHFRIISIETGNNFTVAENSKLDLPAFKIVCSCIEEAEFIIQQMNDGLITNPIIDGSYFYEESTFDDMDHRYFSPREIYSIVHTHPESEPICLSRNLSWVEAIEELKDIGPSTHLSLTIGNIPKSNYAKKRIVDSKGNTHTFKFEWDENKSLINKEKHLLDFNQAIDLFVEQYITTIQEENKIEGREEITLLDHNGKTWRIVFTVVEKSPEGYPENIIRIITCHKFRKRRQI